MKTFLIRTLLTVLLVLLISVTAIAGSGSTSPGGATPTQPAPTTNAVQGWGSSECLQLLLESSTNRLPLSLTSLGSPTSLAAGAASVYALYANGTVSAWGSNSGNELARPYDGSIGSAPAQVMGLPPVTKLFASTHSGFAVTSTGNLWAWGFNGWGELGIGSNVNAVTPTLVGNVGADAKVIGGDSRVLLLKGDGTLWGAGYNYYWDLGLGDRQARNTFTQLPGISNVKSAAFGGMRSGIAATAAGNVYTWGSYYGDTYATATPLPGLSGIVKVAGVPGAGYALSSTGTLYSWGTNDSGQLGRSGPEETPSAIPGLPPIADVFGAQGGTAYAIGRDGTVWAWGNGDYGQIGDGFNRDRYEPVRVIGLSSGTVSLLAPGRTFVLALIGSTGPAQP